MTEPDLSPEIITSLLLRKYLYILPKLIQNYQQKYFSVNFTNLNQFCSMLLKENQQTKWKPDIQIYLFFSTFDYFCRLMISTQFIDNFNIFNIIPKNLAESRFPGRRLNIPMS